MDSRRQLKRRLQVMRVATRIALTGLAVATVLSMFLIAIHADIYLGKVK